MNAIARSRAYGRKPRHKRTVRAATLALILAVSATVAATAGGFAQPALASTATPSGGQGAGLRADFDGDGITDLAMGVPGEDLGLVQDAGAVNVVYGTADGLTATGNQMWHQDSVGIFGDPEEDDLFGSALAAGDFDGDGRTDLAVSVPGESFINYHAGGVHVLYGTADGLTATGSQFFSQNDPNIFGEAEAGDQFGQTLAAADFDNDGNSDLAISTPWENFVADGAGVVHVLYGSTSGLRAAGSDFFSQNDADIFGEADEWDLFGFALATGDLNDDGIADLSVSTPYEDFMAENAGVVHVLYGSSGGLRAAGSGFFSQNDSDIFGDAEEGDEFGYSLAAADFDHDGDGDLAISAPYEDFIAENAGVVHVLYGSTTGLRRAGSDFFSQNDGDIFGDAEEGDLFGFALAAGNFGNGSEADLAVSSPLESFADTQDGGVHVLYGSSTGVRAAGSQFWSQNGGDLVEDAEYGDKFGYTLTAGNFGNGSYADLAVGVPFKAPYGAGGVHIIYGGESGLTATGDQFWTQYALEGGEESSDNLGLSLAGG